MKYLHKYNMCIRPRLGFRQSITKNVRIFYNWFWSGWICWKYSQSAQLSLGLGLEKLSKFSSTTFLEYIIYKYITERATTTANLSMGFDSIATQSCVKQLRKIRLWQFKIIWMMYGLESSKNSKNDKNQLYPCMCTSTSHAHI